MGGLIMVIFGIFFAAFIVWGLIESWKTPGLGKEGFFRKIGKTA